MSYFMFEIAVGADEVDILRHATLYYLGLCRNARKAGLDCVPGFGYSTRLQTQIIILTEIGVQLNNPDKRRSIQNLADHRIKPKLQYEFEVSSRGEQTVITGDDTVDLVMSNALASYRAFCKDAIGINPSLELKSQLPIVRNLRRKIALGAVRDPYDTEPTLTDRQIFGDEDD